MKVAKYSGELVEFEKDKLVKSLLKSGADEVVVAQILNNVERELYDGIPTKKLYKLAYQQLKNYSKVHAARYHLRSAILALGPAGFYFEKFIAKVFENEGYQVLLNQTLQGNCVSHEIDVLLKKEGQITMVECKFHANQDVKTDVKVPMYILSRFNDLKKQSFDFPWGTSSINRCILVTNNRFTEDALTFANCSVIAILSWDAPLGNSIRDKVDTFQLYPITCLTTLSMAEKELLLQQEIIIVKDVLSRPDSLSFIGISPGRIKNIIKEAQQLCHNNKALQS